MVERRIYIVRNHRVMLDSDLADLYEVPTKSFNQAVKRNQERFPADFMLRLTTKETEGLRSQIVTSNDGRGGRRYLPYAFTEQGIAMLSSVLNSPRAVQVNIAIMRVFVEIRTAGVTQGQMVQRLNRMEKKYDAHFRVVFDAIREILLPEPQPLPPKRRIGFQVAGAEA